MNSEVSFSGLAAVIFDKIVGFAERSPLCDEYDCKEGVIELFLRRDTLLIVSKANLAEIWVSGLAIGAERFRLDGGERFVNKSGEEIVSWMKKILQL